MSRIFHSIHKIVPLNLGHGVQGIHYKSFRFFKFKSTQIKKRNTKNVINNVTINKTEDMKRVDIRMTTGQAQKDALLHSADYGYWEILGLEGNYSS